MLITQLNDVASLAKYLSVRFAIKWPLVRIWLLSLKLQIWRLPRARSSFTFRQTIECGFHLKLVHHVTISYSHMHRTHKYSQYSLMLWSVWLNGWMFVHVLSSCGFESRSCHLNFRSSTCFEQGVPWHSGKL